MGDTLWATNAQKGIVHKLVKELEWSDQVYRDWLISQIKCSSIKLADIAQASNIIKLLSIELEIKTGAPLKITPKQINYIKFLWLSVDYDSGNCGDINLSSFLKRKFDVEYAEHLTSSQARGVIYAIKRMQNNLGNKIHVSRSRTNAGGSKSVYVKTDQTIQEIRISKTLDYEN